MQGIEEAAGAFLENRRIAVTGVSRCPEATEATSSQASVWLPRPEDDPGRRRPIVIGTRPELAEHAMRECVEFAIPSAAAASRQARARA
jgi:hypothetical protein